MTITEFLDARIAEDEAMARNATPGTWQLDLGRGGVGGEISSVDAVGNDWTVTANDDDTGVGGISVQDAAHVIRWQPQRVLAECEAKRRIIDAWQQIGEDEFGQGVDALFLLALPYADHSEYDQSWRV